MRKVAESTKAFFHRRCQPQNWNYISPTSVSHIHRNLSHLIFQNFSPAKFPPSRSLQKWMSHAPELRSQPYRNFPPCSASLCRRCSSLYPKGFTPGTMSFNEHIPFLLPFPTCAPSSVSALLLNSTIPLGPPAFFGGYTTSQSPFFLPFIFPHPCPLQPGRLLPQCVGQKLLVRLIQVLLTHWILCLALPLSWRWGWRSPLSHLGW